MINKQKILESTIYGLFKDQAFYGGLLQELTIKFSKEIPTAAIAYNKTKNEYQIFLGEDYFLNIPIEQRVAVLKHEVLHFTHGHLIRFPWNETTPKEDKLKYNLAGDMAINQFIQNLPEGCVDVSKWKLEDGTPFPKYQSMEVYYDLISKNWEKNKELVEAPCTCDKDKKDQENKNGTSQNTKNKENESENGKDSTSSGSSEESKTKEGNGSNHTEGCPKHGKQRVLDSHEWEELNEEEKKEMLKEAKRIFERSIEKVCHDHSSLPDYIKDMLKEIETAITGINYKRILQDTIKRTVCSSDRQSTWNRRNKRYDVYAPGSKNGSLPLCAMFIDTSGSISHTEANEFLEVISGFLKAGSRKCKLGLWHTDLYYVENYKLNQKLSEDVFQSGGTDVGPTVEYIKKTKPNLSIILTDGYFSHPDITVTKDTEVLWVISKNGNTDTGFLNSLPGKWIKMS